MNRKIRFFILFFKQFISILINIFKSLIIYFFFKIICFFVTRYIPLKIKIDAKILIESNLSLPVIDEYKIAIIGCKYTNAPIVVGLMFFKAKLFNKYVKKVVPKTTKIILQIALNGNNFQLTDENSK